jgi:phosphoserine phosphatase
MTTPAEPALCVDLDGTLIAGDTLRLSLVLCARRKPWLLPVLPFALVGGRAALKRYLASHILPTPRELRWRSSVLEFLNAERARGRRVILVTAAQRRIAEIVADHLQLFDEILATDTGPNLKASAKLAAIRNYLSDNEFDYIGDNIADLPVLQVARKAYLVAPSRRLLASVQRLARLERVFDRG